MLSTTDKNGVTFKELRFLKVAQKRLKEVLRYLLIVVFIPASLVAWTPSVDIEKHTNGQDADTAAEAVQLSPGDTVTWEYIITNTGELDLTNIKVTDDKEGLIACPDTTLPVGESMTCEKTGTAVEGSYTNTATVTAQGCEAGGGSGGESVAVVNPSFEDGSTNGWDYSDGCWESSSYQGEPGKDGTYHAYSADPGKYCGQDVPIDAGSAYTAKIMAAIHDYDEGKGGYVEAVYLDASHTPIGTPIQQKVDDGSCTLAADGGPGFCEKTFDMGAAPAGAAFLRVYGSSGSGQFTKVDNLRITTAASQTCTDVSDSDPSNYVASSTSTPAIKIEKSTNGKDADTAADAYVAQPNENITWEYVVTNIGSEDLKDIVVTDSKGVAVDCKGVTTLAVGKSMTCTATGKATETEYENIGNVEGVGVDSGTKVTAQDPSHYKVNSAPSIKIEKSTNGKDADTAADAYEAKPNEDITWEYVVTNNGTEDLKDIVVTDSKGVAVDCKGVTTLAVGKSMTCTATGKATETAYENIGKVEGVGVNSGTKVTAEDPSHYKVDATPSIDIEKSTNGKDADTAADAVELSLGDSVTWSYVVTNNGTEDLKDIQAKDDKEGAISCPKSELKAGESMTCTAKSGTATVAEYENTATVEGVGVMSGTKVEDSDPSHYKATSNPSIDIEKHTNGKDADTEADAVELAPNAVVTWEYIVTNTGDEILENITVNDDKEGPVDCPQKILQPGESMKCFNKVAKATQMSYENTADVTATGKYSAKEVTDEDPSHYKVVAEPKIDIEKATNGHDADSEADAVELAPGADVVWSYIVKNIGNETIVDIAVEDDKEGSVTCPKTELAPGESMHCVSKYGSANVEKYENKATVTGKGEISGVDVTDEDLSHYKVNNEPSIDIEKATNGVDADSVDAAVELAPGQTVVWEYVVTNNGNEPLVEIAAEDDKEGAIECPKTELAPGESMTCTGKTGVANVEQYENKATVTGKGKVSGTEVTDEDPSHYKVVYNPVIDIEKSTNGVDADTEDAAVELSPNQKVIWEYVITNRGNEKVVDIVANDDKEGAIECPKTELAPGESMTCTAKVGSATEDKYENKASVTGKGEVSGKDVSDEDPSHYVVNNKPSIDIEKHTNGADADSEAEAVVLQPGDAVTWSYTITNNGNEPLIEIAANDDKEGAIECPKSTLQPGESMECTVKSGSATVYHYENKATVVAKGKISGIEVKDEDPSHYTIDYEPKIDVEKSTNGEDADAGKGPKVVVGDSITWEYKVSNIGNEDLKEIVLTDDKLGAITCPKSELAVGESMICIATGTAEAGQYENIAVVKAKGKESDKETADEDPSHYFGEHEACLGDYVWEDTNHDGKQDANEQGIDGVTVKLYDDQGNELSSTVTANGGKYEFCQLKAGKYVVKFEDLPAGYQISPKDATDNASDSDVNPSTQATDVITFSAEHDDMTWDMGIFKPKMCIGSLVWNDKNVNGKQDNGEVGIEGAKVELLNESGNVISSMETNQYGNYIFCDLDEGKYSVRVTPPTGYVPVKIQNPNADDNDPFDSNIATLNGVIGTSGVVELKYNDEPVGSAEDSHLNHNGDEADDSDDKNGNMTVDFAYIQPACIGDYIWEDVNGNGIQESGEPAIKGAKLELFNGDGTNVIDADGNPVVEQITGDDGKYEFCNLVPGEYFVKLTPPAGYHPTLKDQGSDDTKDSDFDPDTMKTVTTTIESGEEDLTWDGGLYRPACIGDYIWHDRNANGKQESGEEPIAGAKFELLNADGTPATEWDGNKLDHIITGEDGEYLFCNLRPGEYRVKVTLPDESYYITTKDASGVDDAKDSDFDPVTKETENTTLESGEKDLTWDVGVFKPACIGNYIWEDLDADGIQDENEQGISGVKVTLKYQDGSSVVDVDGNAVAPQDTNETGGYEFCQLKPGFYHIEVEIPEGYYVTRKDIGSDDAKDSDLSPTFEATLGKTVDTELVSGEKDWTWDGGLFKPACIGDYVWKDENGNGIQDDTDTPLAGAHTILHYADSNESVTNVLGEIVVPQDTDENGVYHYCNLVPGDYVVEFVVDSDENGAPFIATKANEGNDSVDSDIPGFVEGGGTTPVETLTSGEDNRTIDAGFVQEICLGDYVWYDKNLNGVQDSNESGIVGVNVSLLDGSGKSVKDIYGNIVKVVKTDSKGYYKFCHLKPGQDYQIKFDIPESYLPTVQNQGSDLKDSDAGSDGIIHVKKPVRDDMTLDLGIYCECDDYELHPESYEEVKAPALSVFGGLLAIAAITLMVAIRREEA